MATAPQKIYRAFVRNDKVYLGEPEFRRHIVNNFGVKNIVKFSLPLVHYIHDFQPDYILAMDTGARPIGLAVHELYRQIYGPLPTKDGTIKFAKIRGHRCFSDNTKKLMTLLRRMLQDDTKKVFCIDDTINGGNTLKEAKSLFPLFDVRFGTLTHDGLSEVHPDVCADGQKDCYWDWKDIDPLLGVVYDSSGVHSFITDYSQFFRREIIKEARKVAKGVLEE